MKSTAQLTRRIMLNLYDLTIPIVRYLKTMTYIRADLSVNPHDSELMLNRILKHLIRAEDKGMLAMEFFDHDPKAHAKKNLSRYLTKRLGIFSNIYTIISFS